MVFYLIKIILSATVFLNILLTFEVHYKFTYNLIKSYSKRHMFITLLPPLRGVSVASVYNSYFQYTANIIIWPGYNYNRKDADLNALSKVTV